MNDEPEVYELFVTITKQDNGLYDWGIGQELEFEHGEGETEAEFEFLAGGQAESLQDAAEFVADEIKLLFPTKEENVLQVNPE